MLFPSMFRTSFKVERQITLQDICSQRFGRSFSESILAVVIPVG